MPDHGARAAEKQGGAYGWLRKRREEAGESRPPHAGRKVQNGGALCGIETALSAPEWAVEY